MQQTCLECNRTSDQVPLIKIEFQDKPLWICPQHLPILIHKPEKLAEKLPGASFAPTEPHNH